MKYLVIIITLLTFVACQDKACEEEGTGTLCFCNEMDSTRIAVHLTPTIIFDVDPKSTKCTEPLPAGQYDAYIQYSRLSAGMGKNITMYPTVVSCKEVNVRVEEDN